MPAAKLTPKQWTEARVEFESGQYTGIPDFYERWVAKKYGKNGPSLATVTDHSVDERWQKRALVPEIQAAAQKLTIDAYARHGLTTDKVASTSARIVNDVTKTYDDMLAEMKAFVEAEGVDMAKLKGIVEIAKRYISDKKSAATVMDQFHKVTGGYAAVEQKHSGKVTVVHAYADWPMEKCIEVAKKNIALVEEYLARGEKPWEKKTE